MKKSSVLDHYRMPLWLLNTRIKSYHLHREEKKVPILSTRSYRLLYSSRVRTLPGGIFLLPLTFYPLSTFRVTRSRGCERVSGSHSCSYSSSITRHNEKGFSRSVKCTLGPESYEYLFISVYLWLMLNPGAFIGRWYKEKMGINCEKALIIYLYTQSISFWMKILEKFFRYDIC